jgi:hypothetical protein
VREWWLRTLLVLQAPRPVFVALRDDTSEGASERAEPVLAVIILAGIAVALASNAAPDDHGMALVALLFIGGLATGAVAYILLGAVLYWATRLLGSEGSYRRARHLLAYASVPLALSLIASPVGRDRFAWVVLPFVAWSTVLLVIGIKAVHGWSWPRAAAGAVPLLAVAALVLVL